MSPLFFEKIFAYPGGANRRLKILSYAWSALGMAAALFITYWAQTPRQAAPFIFVASAEVIIAVAWGFGPAVLSALIAIVGMGQFFHEPAYSLIVFFAVSALVGFVSERRIRADETLRRQALIFANLTDALIITTPSCKILDVNQAAEVMFGYSKSELVGTPISILQRPEEAAGMEARITAAIAEQGSWKEEIHFVRKDGSEGVSETTVVPIRDTRGNTIARAGITRDVTMRKQLEQKLVQSQRLEAIGRLAGGVAHDFNNLLTAILGYSELLIKQLGEQHRAKAMVAEIERAGRRAATLTSQLLAFSRRQILQPQVLDLNLVLSEMERMLRRLVGEDVTFIMNLDPSIGKVKADRAQIEQVVMNLAANARDAMAAGGTLRIQTADVQRASGPLPEPSEVRFGRSVCLSVEDTGSGMDAQTVAQLFEPFFTTKPTGTAAGLGLSSVYGIVKQSGGEIIVTSVPGQGSRFDVFLPVAETSGSDESHSAMAPGKCPESGETILVVEDDPAVRKLVNDILSHAGYKVLEAISGQEALDLCKKYPGEIDLVISDVVMPSLSGPQAVGIMSRLRPQMRIMFMTGYAEDATASHGLIDTGVQVILKPFTPLQLLQKVGSVLSERPEPDARS